MPISGLILTLADPANVDALAQELQTAEKRLELGTLQGAHLPAVLETSTAKESKDVHDWLLSLPGIVGVDVVFVSADEPDVGEGKGPEA